MIDPTPREPKWDIKWKCAFCWCRTQSSKHYFTECNETKGVFSSENERKDVWNTITTLNNTFQNISVAAEKCKEVIKLFEEKEKRQ